MGRELYANNAASTLATALAPGGLSIDLQPGDGAKFPSPTGGDYFFLTLATSPVESTWEIVKIITRTTDNLTVDAGGRAQQGTSDLGWGIGSRCGNRLTADSLLAYYRNDEIIEEVATPVGSAAGVLTLDFANGNNHVVTLTENVTSVVFNNLPANGKLVPIWIEFNQDGTGGWTVAGWPVSVRWHQAAIPIINPNPLDVHLIAGYTIDDGVNVQLGTAWSEI